MLADIKVAGLMHVPPFQLALYDVVNAPGVSNTASALVLTPLERPD